MVKANKVTKESWITVSDAFRLLVVRGASEPSPTVRALSLNAETLAAVQTARVRVGTPDNCSVA
jgi:hypothetical protein